MNTKNATKEMVEILLNMDEPTYYDEITGYMKCTYCLGSDSYLGEDGEGNSIYSKVKHEPDCVYKRLLTLASYLKNNGTEKGE